MRKLFLLLLATAPLLIYAQNLTGVWQGHFRSDNTATKSSVFDERYRVEVQIAQNNKSLNAVTYSYLSNIFYGKAAAAGTINIHNGKVIIQEGKLLEVRDQFGGGVCTMMYFLQYTKSGDEEFLEGRYVSMNITDSSNCGHGTVFLRKVASSDFYKEPFLVERENELKKDPPKPITKPITHPPVTPHHPDSSAAARIHRPATHPIHHPPAATPAAPPPLARATMPERSATKPTLDSGTGLSHKFRTITPRVLLDRSNQLVRSLTVNTHEVVLNIYDDGIIDGDSVSVYLDNKMVINHAMLTDRPLVVTVHLDEDNDYHELVMVADNEGTIPPNTSLMIVKAGDKEYKVNISTSMQKNATITFKYVKPN
jgi:hypothetical protein